MGFVEVKVKISELLQIVATVFFLRLGYFLIICFPVANFSHCNLTAPDKSRHWFPDSGHRLSNLVIGNCPLENAEHGGKMPPQGNRHPTCQSRRGNYDIVERR